MEESKPFQSPKNVLILILVLALAGLLYYQFGYLPGSTGRILSAQEASEIALRYVNQSMLSGGITASLSGEPKQESGVYKFTMSLQGQEFQSYVTKNGKILFPQGIEIKIATSSGTTTATNQEPPNTTIGSFIVSKDQVCQENSKPIVYFFGSNGCPHCQWEHPIIQQVAQKFADQIVFHNNMDSNEDMDVFSKYNSEGGIPTLVLGCRYYRIGSGENAGEETEAKNLTALICKLTNNQPATVCDQVKELVGQINE